MPTVKFAELPGPVRLPYVEQGDPSGTPVVMLHGYSDSWRSFETLLPYLPASIHAFAPTQRGHGDADRPETGYRPHDFAADVAAFMDAVGLDSAVLVGHSGGSFCAQRFAIDFPERTRGIVLAGSTASLGSNPGVQELREVIMQLSDPVDPGFVREFQAGTLARPVSEAFLDAVVAESLKLPARVWREWLDSHVNHDFSSELGSIDAPTLIVWGEQDALFPRDDQEALLAAIPRSELTAYASTGHAIHWEEPERFAADVVAFAERTGPPARSGGTTGP